jgi:hypothetical protein
MALPPIGESVSQEGQTANPPAERLLVFLPHEAVGSKGVFSRFKNLNRSFLQME